MIVDAIPPDCRRALDVGCGEGALTRELRRVVPEVVGIDTDPASIAAARAHAGARDIRYREGDVLSYDLAPESFDLVTAVASLHHMDAEVALRCVARLLRSGGVLAVIGLARSSLADLPIDAAAVLPNRLGAPCWREPSVIVSPPAETYASMRRVARGVLPGARFRRRLYWRYTLVWAKP